MLWILFFSKKGGIADGNKRIKYYIVEIDIFLTLHLKSIV